MKLGRVVRNYMDISLVFALLGFILEGIVLAIYGRWRKRKEREKFYQHLDRMMMDGQNRAELRKHGI